MLRLPEVSHKLPRPVPALAGATPAVPINKPCRTVSPGAQLSELEVRCQTIPCSARHIPCSEQDNSLFPDGAGNRLQAIDAAWRTSPRPAQRRRNLTKFPKIPC